MSPAAEPSSSSSPQAPSASPDAPTHTPPADALARAPSLTSPQDNPADESALVDEPVQAGPLVEQTSAPVQPVDEGRPPHCAFSPWTRRFIIFTASSVSIFSSLSSNIFVPALPVVASAFNTSIEKINLSVTLYLVFQGVSPMVWASAADAIGRRPVYMGTFTIYVISCIALALVPTSSYAGLLVLRCIQAFGGSSVIALGSGVIADVSEPHERGSLISYFQIGALLGPTLGPVIGGALAEGLGWRSTFWFLVISASVCLVPLILFFPETLRSIVGNGSIPPPALNMTVAALFRRRHASDKASPSDEEAKDQEGPPAVTFRQRWKSIRPLSSLELLLQPDVFLLMFFASVPYAVFYCVLTATSTLFKAKYGLSEVLIGVTYLGNGFGCLVGSLTIGRMLDYDFQQLKKTLADDTPLVEFPLERARFRRVPWIFALFIAATVGFGWAVQVKANLAVPIVCTFFVGLGSIALLSIVSTMSVDLQPGKGSSITASFNFVRSLLGALGSSTIQPMMTHVGEGWAFVIWAGLCIAFAWLPLVILRKGPGWRKGRHRLAEEKKAREAALNEKSRGRQ